MSPWLSRGRWFIRTDGKNSVPSWATREECEAAIEARRRRQQETVEVPGMDGRDFFDAMAQQLPQLTTREQLDAYLADPRVRSVRAKLRAYPLLHRQAEALIDSARAFAVDDSLPDAPAAIAQAPQTAGPMDQGSTTP